MEETDILNLWKTYERKLEANLLLNRQNAADITKMKMQSFLVSMKPVKIFTIAAGIIWVGFLDSLIIHLFYIANPFFLVSAIIAALLNTVAIGVYVYQLVLIQQVAFNETILEAQSKIARLKSSTLWVARLLFLQLPLWTTFYWNKSMLVNGNTFLYTLQVIVTVSFIVMAGWLFKNIRYENRNKKWFGLIFKGNEWTPLMKSMDLLDQLEEYKKENAVI